MQTEIDSSLSVSTQANEAKTKKILVLGLGNILLKDEGVGVRAAEALQEFNLPSNVEVFDGGTAGLDVLLAQRDLHKLIIVDAVKADGQPGTIYQARIKPNDNDVLRSLFLKQEQSLLSLHELGLLSTINIAKKTNRSLQEIIIIGVEPNEIGYGLELTRQVKQRVPEIVELVLEEIKDVVH